MYFETSNPTASSGAELQQYVTADFLSSCKFIQIQCLPQSMLWEADFIHSPGSIWHCLEILIYDLAAWKASCASRRHEKQKTAAWARGVAGFQWIYGASGVSLCLEVRCPDPKGGSRVHRCKYQQCFSDTRGSYGLSWDTARFTQA